LEVFYAGHEVFCRKKPARRGKKPILRGKLPPLPAAIPLQNLKFFEFYDIVGRQPCVFGLGAGSQALSRRINCRGKQEKQQKHSKTNKQR
jgi:hypothetical protein